MNARYAYSFDREGYVGHFDSPEAALKEAAENAQQVPNPPTEVYIGQRMEADPQASHHAESVIHAMRQRALVDIGDSARNYLKTVTPQQVVDLDASIEQTILRWLRRSALSPTFGTVTGIREYPLNSTTPSFHSAPAPRPLVRFKIAEAVVEEEFCCEGAD